MSKPFLDPDTAIERIVEWLIKLRDGTGFQDVSVEIGVRDESPEGVLPFLRIRGEGKELTCYPQSGFGPFGDENWIEVASHEDRGRLLWEVVTEIASVMQPPFGYKWDRERKQIVEEHS